MNWSDLKKKGSGHYKGESVEPIDLYKSGSILRDFAVGSIIKYAFRNRTACDSMAINIQDMKKIIHYAEMLIALEEENTKSE